MAKESEKSNAITSIVDSEAFFAVTIVDGKPTFHSSGKNLKYLIGKAWIENETFQKILNEAVSERENFEQTKYKLN